MGKNLSVIHLTGLRSRICIKQNKKEKKESLEKWTWNLNREFSKKKINMTKK